MAGGTEDRPGIHRQRATIFLTARRYAQTCEEAQQRDKAVAQWRMVPDLEPDHPERMKPLNLLDKQGRGSWFGSRWRFRIRDG